MIPNIGYNQLEHQAAGNLKDLHNKNIEFFNRLSEAKRNLRLNFIYNLFANFADKGSEYKDSHFNFRSDEDIFCKRPSEDDNDIIILAHSLLL